MVSSIVVLKFGSSVLDDPGCLPTVVSEIARRHQEGYQVIAVISVSADATNSRWVRARSCRLVPSTGAPEAVDSLRGKESAAQVALGLEQAGIVSELLDRGAIEPIAAGNRGEGCFARLAICRLQALLSRADVVVIPGENSDLTALYLAHLLSAKCALM